MDERCEANLLIASVRPAVGRAVFIVREHATHYSAEARFTSRTENCYTILPYYQPITRKYLTDYATQRVLRWLLESGEREIDQTSIEMDRALKRKDN